MQAIEIPPDEYDYKLSDISLININKLDDKQWQFNSYLRTI